MIGIFFAHINFSYAQQLPSLTPPPAAAPTAIVPTKPRAAPTGKHPGAAPDNPAGKTAEAVKNPADEKIVNNPFVPGGTTTVGQVLTRKDVMALLDAQEARLRQELSGQTMNADEIAKLMGNATNTAAMAKPDNFMGCVNGVPLYRQIDGTLDLGTHDPEPIRQERCGK